MKNLKMTKALHGYRRTGFGIVIRYGLTSLLHKQHGKGGIKVGDYNFFFDALTLKPSDFCNVRVNNRQTNDVTPGLIPTAKG